MKPVCECHGEPMLRAGIYYGKQRWRCSVKHRVYQRSPRANELRRGRESNTASQRKHSLQRTIRRDARRRRMGKLLNLSVNPGASEHERRIARDMYHNLKARKVA